MMEVRLIVIFVIVFFLHFHLYPMFYSNNQLLHLCIVFCLYLHLSFYLYLYLSSGQEWRGSRLCVGKPPAIAITISINSPDILLWPRLKSQAPSTAVTSLTAITGCSTRFPLLCNTFSVKVHTKSHSQHFRLKSTSLIFCWLLLPAVIDAETID